MRALSLLTSLRVLTGAGGGATAIVGRAGQSDALHPPNVPHLHQQLRHGAPNALPGLHRACAVRSAQDVALILCRRSC